ncbi:MAG: Guanylate kinase [Chlamydiia bacterium]|nr:Guanylate kinase [Chlamydiia bacterium]MCH9617962.1 Guanylate kinase [Chlamydiia bacterium]MCH9623713.1 Guanylate kinase [Chlamydiia bacterium]
MFNNSKDRLFVISAPSAAGKTTIINRLISLLGGSLHRVITCTTRKPRDGEVHNVDYNFLSPESYNKLLKEGAFIEHASVYGNHYGVLHADLNKPGLKVISVDSKGIENFKTLGVKASYILIMPPSLEVLKQRLLKRDTESPEDIELRMAEAKKELEQSSLYDHIIINDNLEEAIDALQTIITGDIENEK